MSFIYKNWWVKCLGQCAWHFHIPSLCHYMDFSLLPHWHSIISNYHPSVPNLIVFSQSHWAIANTTSSETTKHRGISLRNTCCRTGVRLTSHSTKTHSLAQGSASWDRVDSFECLLGFEFKHGYFGLKSSYLRQK